VENLVLTGPVSAAGTGNGLANVITGNSGGNLLSGGAGADTLDGGAGADELVGGLGKDTLIWDAADWAANGGSGTDTLRLAGAGLTLDLAAVPDEKIVDMEFISLSGTGDNNLLFTAGDVLTLSSTSDTLRVNGNAGDSVSAGTGWLYTGNIASSGQTYARYTQGAAVLQVDTDIGRNVGFSINLSSLTGATGFQISGEAANDRSGGSVAGAGDVNGDGFADLIVGAASASPHGGDSGASYVVFGKAGGFGANLDLSSLTGTTGFQMSGEAGFEHSGRSVSAAGDVNGDGFGDLLVGAYDGPSGGAREGASYVVFGKAAGFGANLDLSSLTGADGFQITGVFDYDHSGRSVSAAGDVNGDGFADLIIGASSADPHGSSSGASYVVFGQAGGFAANLGLATLTGAAGFKISGGAASDRSGSSVSAAGDVNGDGLGDLIIGAPGAGANGASYVVFGQEGGFEANLDLTSLTGANGFRISGEAASDGSGNSVAAAGDVNGDGFGDLIIGAPYADPNGITSGASYVVFGQAGGFGANVDLTSLTGATGFKISGEAAIDQSGMSVSAAGDMNGDGFGDLLVGARYADPNGSYSGASYVVFGHASGFAANLDLSSLTGATGFQISGEATNDQSGRSASGAGDVNGDGFDDVLVGASYADPHGSNSGASYVVFGRDYRGDVDFIGGAGNNSFTGTAAAENLVGGRGDDTLAGGGGVDVLIGGAGDDVLVYDALDRKVDGGSGEDTLAVKGGDITVELGAGHVGLEVIDLTGSGDNALIVSVRDVLNLSGTSNTLRVDGDDGDELISTGEGWLVGETADIDGVTYQIYTSGAATLLASTEIIQLVS
jgi:hypothetical protein